METKSTLPGGFRLSVTASVAHFDPRTPEAFSASVQAPQAPTKPVVKAPAKAKAKPKAQVRLADGVFFKCSVSV